MIYNSLQGIFTTMIGFVAWPPLLYHHLYKGGQVTKQIIVVKMPGCKLIYVSKRIFLALLDIKGLGRL